MPPCCLLFPNSHGDYQYSERTHNRIELDSFLLIKEVHQTSGAIKDVGGHFQRHYKSARLTEG